MKKRGGVIEGADSAPRAVPFALLAPALAELAETACSGVPFAETSDDEVGGKG
jgi:hypothetical protein